MDKQKQNLQIFSSIIYYWPYKSTDAGQGHTTVKEITESSTVRSLTFPSSCEIGNWGLRRWLAPVTKLEDTETRGYILTQIS